MLLLLVAKRTHQSHIARCRASARRSSDCSNNPLYGIHTAAPRSAANTLQCGPQARVSRQIRVGLQVLTGGTRAEFHRAFLGRKFALNLAISGCFADEIDAA